MFFDYHLPDHLIAQQPAANRADARLLVVYRDTGTLEHRHVRDLPQILRPGDCLVLNDTKVIPARLLGRRDGTGGKWEALYLRTIDDHWELMCQTRGYATAGEAFTTDTGLTLTLRDRTDDRHWLMSPHADGEAATLLAKYGHVPLPLYIRKGVGNEADESRYQTVFAAQPGSVAAPTAGLHFTPGLLNELAANGVSSSRVTLHVGLGTFAPVKETNPLDHVIHEEWCEVTAAAVEEICHAKRVIAVGTTSTRTLESAARDGTLKPYRGGTALAIYPPFEFHAIDGLMTNFHLPRTTLLLLVQALCGSELLHHAYHEAIRQDYRFYSYGDAMLIL